MRSPLIILIFFMPFAPYSLAQDCGPARFQLLLVQADTAVANGEYDLAINKLQSAKVCQPDSEAMVNKRVITVFLEVNRQRKLAIQREKIAKSNELAAIAQYLSSVTNNEKELIMDTDPNEPFTVGRFEGRKLNTILAMFIESFRINPSALNRAGLKDCIDQLGVLDTMFTPAGKANCLQTDQWGHNVLFSSKLQQGQYKLEFLDIYHHSAQKWDVSIDTVYQIFRINRDGFLISGYSKLERKNVFYVLEDEYEYKSKAFIKVLKPIAIEVPGVFVKMYVLNPETSCVLIAAASTEGAMDQLRLTLVDVTKKGETLIRDQLTIDNVPFNFDMLAFNHNTLMVSEYADSIGFWRVDSVFTFIKKKQYPFSPTSLAVRMDGAVSLSESCCKLVFDHALKDSMTIGFTRVKERYFTLKEWVGEMEFSGDFLLASTRVETDFQVIYAINVNFLIRPTSLGGQQDSQ